jgi:hypothetical protein
MLRVGLWMGDMKLTLRKRALRVQTDPKQVEQRRKALKDIGKFGLYMAPALLALLKSGRASASVHNS